MSPEEPSTDDTSGRLQYESVNESLSYEERRLAATEASRLVTATLVRAGRR